MFIIFTPLKSQRCLKKYFLLGGLVKCFFSLKSPKIMKSGWGDWKGISCHEDVMKSELPWEPNFFTAVGALPVEL